MSINSNISLSTAARIEDAIQYSTDEFSAVDTMGSLANNAKFKAGYDELAQGKHTPKSYVWEMLSAVAEDFGQSLYANIRCYIDNVSNIDACKIHALKSMMHMVNVDYSVLDKIGYYPIEIQHLMDILSISKKYLLSNKHVKQDFLDAVTADGCAQRFLPSSLVSSIYFPEKNSGDPSNPENHASLSDECMLSIGIASSDVDYYLLQSNDAFESYLSGIYNNFIYDMLTMHGTGSCSSTVLLSTGFLSTMYGPYAGIIDKYIDKKKENNIDMSFNVEQVVNDIEVGIDSIGNYAGPQLSLLQEEISYRKSPDTSLSSLDLATRYNYYRKQKIVEYAEFVDNMVFLPTNFSSYAIYEYDTNYLTMLSNAQLCLCIKNADTSNPTIDNAAVSYAAVTLAHMTQYISKLRDVLKLQVRKVFMKGTNNLLQYSANEFLVDYIDTMRSSMPEDQLSVFAQHLSAHLIDDVIVQEYWDLNEYMNISSDTTPYAVNQRACNGRYFDETFSRENGTLVPTENNIFTNEDLNEFYLNTLGLANTLSPAISGANASLLSSNFYEFLSVLFDVAADRSYYSAADGTFNTKLSNDIITEEVKEDLSTILSIDQFVEDAAVSSGYSFDESACISAQVNEFAEQTYFAVRDKNLEGISSTYEQYCPTVDQLSTEMATLKNDFIQCITKTYSCYFEKSSSLYSYSTDGEYLFPYYVGNTNYINDNSYEQSSTHAREWINDDNCYTLALSTAIDQLSATYDSCKQQIDAIADSLQHLDYISPNSDDLGADMDSIQQFMNTKIQQRNTYLQSILQELRSQASDAKAEYDSIKTTFSSVLASLPSLPHQDFYMSSIGITTEPGYRLVDSVKEDNDNKHENLYDAISQAYYMYYESKRFPKFKRIKTDTYLDELYAISDSDTLEKQMNTCADLLKLMSKINFGMDTSATKTFGTQKVTIQSLQASITSIVTKTLPSISDRLNELFGLEIAQDSTACCIDQINNTITFLTNNVSEQNFNDDAVIREYYNTLRDLTEVSCNQYISAKSSYEALWTEFDDFFADFAKSSNYMSFIPYNLSCIDEYRQKKDAVALAQINEQFDAFDSIYQSLQKQFISICNDDKIMLYDFDLKQYQYMYSGEALEFCLEGFVDAMKTDIAAKEIIANNIATEVYNSIVAPDGIYDQVCELYKKYFPSKLRPYKNDDEYRDKFSAMMMSFLDVITSIIDKLSYSEAEAFNQFKDLFKNYSGVPGIATDPYYNVKNQTHPSYQIHPFMWNFIEYYPVTTAIEMVARQVTGIDYSAYESASIMSTIDRLIGKFGNMIDVWKTGINDFTGYQTKYEYSNHICQRTGMYSEVVGYEGAFYPPALDAYIKSSSPHGLSKIEKYYSHLKLDYDSALKEKIDLLLKSSYNSIKDITVAHTKPYVYDIYKYYVDQHENMYILYKRYGKDNPTERDKLETPGQLWVRLADSPIAFPLSGVASSPPDMSIYDMCMIADGNKIVLTGKFNGNSFIQSQAFYITYKTNNVCGLGTLELNVKEDNVVENTQRFPADDDAPHYKYVGSLNNSQNNITVAYIQDEKQNPVAKIFTIAPHRARANVTNVELADIDGFIDEVPALAQHTAIERGATHQYVDLLFAVDDASKFDVATSYKSLSTDIVSAAAGYTYDDPAHASMNSLDFIDGQLVLKSIRIDDNDIQKIYSTSSRSLQTNTDMGYIPSYTYDKYENVLDIRSDLCSSYQMVELLGKSKDIEDVISRTNPESNPYVTKQDLFDKYMYGRIYEDMDGVQFNGLSDESINILENKSLYENMPNEYDGQFVYNYVNGHYQWNIRLNDMYSYDKLRKMRLFIYSTVSLGKNPYVVEEMADVIDKSNALAQNEFLSTNYNASQFDITTISFNDASFQITMNGTQNGIDQIDSTFSNKLPNIIDFTYKYFKMVDGSMYLKLDFKLDNVNADGYIEEGAIKVAFVDMLDLSFFNWYHYLDPGVTFGDFQYIVNRINGDPLTKAQLMSLDMSQYDYLSDVQVNGLRIFDTNHRIQFKISEEDVFPVSSYNYYVPSLNTKYPMTMSQAFDKQYNVPADLIASEVNIFQPDEVYELEVADASILNMLDTIGMEFTNLDDGFRVFEDYFYVQPDGTANSGRFSPDDPQFYQYVHFFTVDPGATSVEDALSIQQSACIDVRVQKTYDSSSSAPLDPFSIELDKLNVWAMHGEQLGESDSKDIYVRDFDFKNLPSSEKDRVLKEAKKFMRLHFNYAKAKNGIIIYVNYANYINSPYVKLVDGKPYLALVDNTYLRLLPGESGLVSVVVQFRQLLNGILTAVKNVVVATYKVYNVSDDKPKFVVEKISQLS